MEYIVLTKKEKDFLNYNIQEIKRFIVKKHSYYMLDGTEESKIKYLKYSVLSSWFSDINTYDDFVEKFESFSGVLGNDKVKDLFQEVKYISTIKDDQKETIIKRTIDKYIETSSNKSYLSDAEKSGYSLPDMYLNDNSYKDYSLHKNIYFANLLYNYLIKIDKHLKTVKGELIKNRTETSKKTYRRK